MKCTKIRHTTELDARIVLSLLTAKEHGEQRAYRCPRCGGFHLTSKRNGGNR